MKTIYIDNQESAAALASAFAAALAEEIGWTAEKDENGTFTGNVKKDGINIYFRFYVSSSYIYLTVSNGYIDIPTSIYIGFSATNAYRLDILETSGGSIAVGIGKTADAPYMGVLIVRNTAGAYVGILINGNNSVTIRGLESSTRSINLSLNSSTGVSTSIVKMPDIWGAAMFNDLYYVVSCPYNATARTFSIGGKVYRCVGIAASYQCFALPED